MDELIAEDISSLLEGKVGIHDGKFPMVEHLEGMPFHQRECGTVQVSEQGITFPPSHHLNNHLILTSQ